MKKKFLVLLAAGLLAAPMAAMAGPVTWYLQGVTFNDGGAATGSFIYDADANAFSGIDITTTAGTTRAGSRYTFPTGIGTDAIGLLEYWFARHSRHDGPFHPFPCIVDE